MFAWDPYFLSKASLLFDVLLERTSCSNRYKAFSASPPDHFGRALSCALSGEEPQLYGFYFSRLIMVAERSLIKVHEEKAGEGSMRFS